jgi:hypothetical protein
MAVVIGLFATMVGCGLLFMAANGMMSVSPTGYLVSGPVIEEVNGMQRLQPVLGQAIVDLDLLDRRYATDASAAIAQLTRVSGEYMRWLKSPFGYLDSIRTSAMGAEDNHAARVQPVLGHAIVRFTQRGVRSDILSSEGKISDFNTRMIDRADALGQRMEAEFVANWQGNLGRAIVGATQGRAQDAASTQERLGSAIVQLATVQTVYEAAHAAAQEHLGAATFAATRMKSQISGTGPEHSALNPVVRATAPLSWPDLPMSAIVVASLVLVCLFSAGLLMSPRRPGAHVGEFAQDEPTALVSYEAV